MALTVRGLSKSFPGLDLLRGLDLDVATGETVSIRGVSGTGKSTLLHCLGLLESIDRGSIALDGSELTTLGRVERAAARARRVGFVFQAFHLLPEFDVEENVLMSARTACLPIGPARERVRELVDRVGLGERLHAHPRTLSGGERQRVALCRALLPSPALLLADEPTGNLDPATASVVLDLILDLARSARASVVIVTHDPQVAGRADRVLELCDGRLESSGVRRPASDVKDSAGTDGVRGPNFPTPDAGRRTPDVSSPDAGRV